MSFELKKEVNGWKVYGTDDLDALQNDPSLFRAEKADQNLVIRHSVLFEGLTIETPPTEDKQAVSEYQGYSDWRLRWQGYDIARGRTLEEILKKAVRFMEYQ
jgi:hypothetical protein